VGIEIGMEIEIEFFFTMEITLVFTCVETICRPRSDQNQSIIVLIYLLIISSLAEPILCSVSAWIYTPAFYSISTIK